MKTEYEVVIGLEVHLQLNTLTKAFCGCSTEFGASPNTQVCPVCLGFPGSLPVLNGKVMEHAIKVALALNCQVQTYTRFDRKNYFYPDLPKNYQISQYDLPLSLNGFLDINVGGLDKRIGIKRAHLEEDAGKLVHESDCSLVDFNRAGVPLLEIVSEPDMRSPDEAYEYLTVLKAILKYLEVSDCDMEKGSLRCDANISLRRAGDRELGVKAELKNMNSFKAVKDALVYEASRQEELLEKQEPVIQETLLWDADKIRTYSMRTKEEAMDYRYFPEPDLAPFIISQELVSSLKSRLPELPVARRERFIREYGLSVYDSGLLTADKSIADYFESCFKLYPKAKIICNWLTGAVMAELNSRGADIGSAGLRPESLITLLEGADKGTISNLAAKDILKEMFDTGKSPEAIIKEKDLSQISDAGPLEEIADKVILDNLKSAQAYKVGKGSALMFLVGQAMKLSKGKANPKVVGEILKRRLDNA